MAKGVAGGTRNAKRRPMVGRHFASPRSWTQFVRRRRTTTPSAPSPSAISANDAGSGLTITSAALVRPVDGLIGEREEFSTLEPLERSAK